MTRANLDGDFCVVVCDDNIVVQERCRRTLSGIPGVSVVSVDHPVRIIEVLRTLRKPSVLIMDLEFPVVPGSGLHEAIGHKILPLVRKEFRDLKIIIMTKLGPAVYPIIIETSRFDLHDDWIDSSRALSDGELRARVERFLYPFGKEISDSGLWAMQISDLHFGNSAIFEYLGRSEDGALLDAFLEDLSEVFPRQVSDFERPHLVICNGDCSHRGRDAEFVSAAKFFRGICEMKQARDIERGNGGNRKAAELAAVPGNHDINWDISRARCLKGSPLMYCEIAGREEISDDLRYLKKYMWAPFEEFLISSGARPPDFGRYWNKSSDFSSALWRLSHLGIDLFGFNSSHDKVDHLSQNPGIKPDDLLDLQAEMEIESGQRERRLKIVLVHHPIGSIGGDAERSNNSELMGLRQQLRRKLDMEIVLTGHTHRELTEIFTVEDTSILSIGAGSAGSSGKHDKRPDLLQYNILRIFPHSPASTRPAKIEVYSRLILQGKFVAHPEVNGRTFEWEDGIGWKRKLS